MLKRAEQKFESTKVGLMKSWAFVFLCLSLISPVVYSAQELPRRSLELELEEIEGVAGYHIEVSRILNDNKRKKPVLFKLTSNKWTAKLVPGRYAMRVRSVDSRGVPGEWGPPQEFAVKLPTAEPIKPAAGSVVKSDESDTEKVEFEWKEIPGAEKYKIRVVDTAGGVVHESVENGTSLKVKLRVAQDYSWQVIAVTDEGVEGDTTDNPPRFTLHGGPLERPSIADVEDVNTKKMNWNEVKNAKQYEFSLEKYNKESGGWKQIDKKTLDKPERLIARPLPSGTYRMKVAALGEKWEPSQVAEKEFETQYLNARSPAAIEQFKRESTYDTKSVIFALASYYITFVNYSGFTNETNAGATYSAIGGTGRLGIGTWFKESSKWGVSLIGDMSGYTVGTTTQTYFSGGPQGVFRYRLGGLGQLRAYGGVLYRQLPVTYVTNANDPNNGFKQTTITNMGPVIGASLYRGINSKFGMQFNLQLFHSTMASQTPAGANKPDLSYQAGLLGSLSLTKNLIGFLGYAYRAEKAKYEGAIRAGGSTSSAGTDEVTITGHYLNLMLEYGF